MPRELTQYMEMHGYEPASAPRRNLEKTPLGHPLFQMVQKRRKRRSSMSKEYAILDQVVSSVTIGNASSQDDSTSGLPRHARYLQRFAAICQPQREVPIFFRG